MGAGHAKETDLPPSHPPLPLSQLDPSGSPAINLKTSTYFQWARPDTDQALQFVDCRRWWPLHNRRHRGHITLYRVRSSSQMGTLSQPLSTTCPVPMPMIQHLLQQQQYTPGTDTYIPGSEYVSRTYVQYREIPGTWYKFWGV